MLKYIGTDSLITDSPEEIIVADKLILPGVGSFDMGMKKLKEHKLVDAIVAHVSRNKPILGICLGMQMLGRKSEEGIESGLGLIPMDTVKFKLPEGYKVPHMGWNQVAIEADTDLTKNLTEKERYYFVHSFHAQCDSDTNVLMSCNYGETFPAAVFSNNVFGVQFHPEKSHEFGMRLLRNFVGIV
jgi:glutamine amidotransferase